MRHCGFGQYLNRRNRNMICNAGLSIDEFLELL
jgi:hypothetical protein